MSRPDEMMLAASGAPYALLRIKQSYRLDEQKVYLVVEGKDDKAFYGPRVSDLLATFGRVDGVEVVIASTRSQVVLTEDALDWNKFSRHRIAFVVDRDYSSWEEKEPQKAFNVYVTDGYAIENSVCNQGSFLQLCERKCNSSSGCTDNDRQYLKERYSRALNLFRSYASDLMRSHVIWRIGGCKPNFGNWKFAEYFKIECGEILPKYSLEEMLTRSRKTMGVDDGFIPTESQIAATEGIREIEEIELFFRGKNWLEYFKLIAKSLEGGILPSRATLKGMSGITIDSIMLCASLPASFTQFIKKVYLP